MKRSHWVMFVTYEERSTAGVFSIFKDSVAGGSDVIMADGSPSAPATLVESASSTRSINRSSK